MGYKDKYLKVEDIRIHYLDNEFKSEELVIILPSGIYDASLIEDLNLGTLSKRIITITYPSRGKSDIIDDNSIDNISRITYTVISELLSIINPKYVKILGFSFGSAIATVMFQKYLRVSKDNIKLFLLNPGEFFNPFTRVIIKLIFFPSKYFLIYGKISRFLVCDVFKIFRKEFFPDNRLKYINDQWFSSLNYRISSAKLNIDTTLCIGRHDRVVNKNSINKLLIVYERSKVVEYNGDHIRDYLRINEYPGVKDSIIDYINSD